MHARGENAADIPAPAIGRLFLARGVNDAWMTERTYNKLWQACWMKSVPNQPRFCPRRSSCRGRSDRQPPAAACWDRCRRTSATPRCSLSWPCRSSCSPEVLSIDHRPNTIGRPSTPPDYRRRPRTLTIRSDDPLHSQVSPDLLSPSPPACLRAIKRDVWYLRAHLSARMYVTEEGAGHKSRVFKRARRAPEFSPGFVRRSERCNRAAVDSVKGWNAPRRALPRARRVQDTCSETAFPPLLSILDLLCHPVRSDAALSHRASSSVFGIASGVSYAYRARGSGQWLLWYVRKTETSTMSSETDEATSFSRMHL